MLLSNSSGEWDNTYKDVKYILREYPLKLEKNERSTRSVSDLRRYRVSEICCNLLLFDNSVTGSNHLSIIFHLRTGGIWTICQQTTKLMERQQYFINGHGGLSNGLFFDRTFLRLSYKAIYPSIIYLRKSICQIMHIKVVGLNR